MPLEVRLPEPITMGPDRCVLEALALQPAARATRYDIISEVYGVEAARKDSGAQLMALATLTSMNDAQLAEASRGIGNTVDLSLPQTKPKNAPKPAPGSSPPRPPELQLEDLRLRVEQEVRDAYRLTELTAQVYNLGLAQLATAQEAKSIASAQYRAGLVPYSQLYAVQLELWKAARNGVDAFYDYLAARSRLDFARGVDPDPSP